MRIEYHRTLIADQVRNKAFREALAAVIKKGESTVADIGAGTGLLGLMAAELGAREVILYEKGEIGAVAVEVIKKNRASRRCTLMACDSREMQDPPRADIVVSETLGNYALEENIIDTLADARKRHLKPGGVVIPRRIAQWVAPVTGDRLHIELTAWDRACAGIDLSPARAMSLNNAYVRSLDTGELLDGMASGRVWDEVDLTCDVRASRKGEVSWKLTHDATIYGFASWWHAELVPGVLLSTAPDAPRTHWEQLYFPLQSPIAAVKGETVMLSLRSRSSEEQGTHLAWTAVHFDAAGKSRTRQAMDLDKGWIP